MIHAYAAKSAKAKLVPFEYKERALEPYEVEIQISHCGLCHTDIHFIDNAWNNSIYPLIPGHEIVGTIVKKGDAVQNREIAQRVGVGYQRSADLACELCKSGNENICAKKTVTCLGYPGGFAERMIADGRFTFPIPDAIKSEFAGPLMCAGATVYAPMKRHLAKPGTVGIIGIGGLGHLAIQFAKALGHKIIAISHSEEKRNEVLKCGADQFLNSADTKSLEDAAESCDFILNTPHTDQDWNLYVKMLKGMGTLCFVGRPPHDVGVTASLLTSRQRQISGSSGASRKGMVEMLKFAAEQKVAPQIELFPMSEVNAAIEKVRKNQVRYRAVLKN